MKHLLKKLFYWDAPDQGALFGLTLWLIWIYIAFPFSLWQSAVGDGNQPGPIGKIAAESILWIVWALTVYLATMMLIFCYRSCRESTWRRYVFWGMLGCLVSLLAESVLYDDLLRPVLLTLLFGCWLLPALLIGKIRGYTYCLHGLVWTGAAVILAAAHHKFWAETEMSFLFKRPFYGTEFYRQTANLFGISGDEWVWFTLLGVLLLLGGYLLAAKIWSDVAAVKLRRMFTRNIMALWGLFALVYLIFLIMALTADHQLWQKEQALAQRFGRPVSAPALGQLYYGNDQPDRGYWQTVASLARRCQVDDGGVADYDLDPATAPPFYRARFAEMKDDLARWEQAFSGPIPPDPWVFEPGKLWDCNYEYSRTYIIRQFDYLEVWQIYLALRNHNLKDALDVYWRIKHVNDFLLREFQDNGGRLWSDCENIRLDALQFLLESNELTTDDLQTLAADLRTVEQQLPANFERGHYTLVTNTLDGLISWGQGGFEHRSDEMALPLKKLRFYYPLIWWKADKITSNYIQELQNEKFEPGIVSPLGETRKYFRLLLRLRAAQTIIHAVEYQRQHGEYPQTLDDLPANPFTGQPLQYRVGNCEIKIQTAVKDKNTWYTETLSQTVPAIQCWGLEPDRQYPIDFTVRIKLKDN